MPFFHADGLNLAYETWGEGPPILLIHGFGSSIEINWVNTGWVETLTGAGYRVIAIDNRGHGRSEKFYDTDYYWAHLMSEDAANLLRHLEIDSAHVLGYSMGARISAFLATRHPEMIRALVLGGMGRNLITGLDDSDEIIAGLRAETLSEVTHPTARMFRIFADHSKADRLALAACMVTSREQMIEEEVRSIEAPTLICVGEADDMAGSPFELAELIEGSEAFVIPRRTHMLATGDRAFKQKTLEFLAAHSNTGRQK